jgi:hypothetical protein
MESISPFELTKLMDSIYQGFCYYVDFEMGWRTLTRFPKAQIYFINTSFFVAV